MTDGDIQASDDDYVEALCAGRVYSNFRGTKTEMWHVIQVICGDSLLGGTTHGGISRPVHALLVRGEPQFLKRKKCNKIVT